MYKYRTKQEKHRRAGWIFLLLVLLGYAAVGGYERYLDRKLEILVECKDGSRYYDTLRGNEDFKCTYTKLTFL